MVGSRLVLEFDRSFFRTKHFESKGQEKEKKKEKMNKTQDDNGWIARTDGWMDEGGAAID